MSKSYRSSEPIIISMVEACQKIREYLSRTTEKDFLKQKESFDAICLQLAHIGEQVSLLKDSQDRVIQHFPTEVPWAALKGLRNQIDHQYLTIDAEMIWRFTNEEINSLTDALNRILKKRFGKTI